MNICIFVFCTDKVYSSTDTRVHIFCSWIWPLNLLQGVSVYMVVNIYSTAHTSVCMYMYKIKPGVQTFPHRQVSFTLCSVCPRCSVVPHLGVLWISNGGSQAVVIALVFCCLRPAEGQCLLSHGVLYAVFSGCSV